MNGYPLLVLVSSAILTGVPDRISCEPIPEPYDYGYRDIVDTGVDILRQIQKTGYQIVITTTPSNNNNNNNNNNKYQQQQQQQRPNRGGNNYCGPNQNASSSSQPPTNSQRREQIRYNGRPSQQPQASDRDRQRERPLPPRRPPPPRPRDLPRVEVEPGTENTDFRPETPDDDYVDDNFAPAAPPPRKSDGRDDYVYDDWYSYY